MTTYGAWALLAVLLAAWARQTTNDRHTEMRVRHEDNRAAHQVIDTAEEVVFRRSLRDEAVYA